MPSVLQDWVANLSFMQQSVLISAIRGCDGLAKRHKAKDVVRFYRRVVVLSAFDRRALTDPFEPGGGSFTGPIADLTSWRDAEPHPITEYDHRCNLLQKAADDFIDSRDELPYHYTGHMMHAFEIVGYKHPDQFIRDYFSELYGRLVKALHCWPETEAELDKRLGDDIDGWHAREDRSSNCSM